MTPILPQPQSLTLAGAPWIFRHKSHYSTGLKLVVSADPGLEARAGLLADCLREENHLPAVVDMDSSEGDIHLGLGLPPRQLPEALTAAGFEDESHRIKVSPDRVIVTAATASGISMAIQSLRQMLSGQRARVEIPGMIIEDAPAMGWRGLHLDVARHFRDAGDVRRFIDLAAFHKFNLFHWHLTDDQGWRLPVEGYPRLAEIAAWRDGTLIGHDCNRSKNPADGIRHGGFYSHEEIRDIVAYAALRGVRVLPEVDVPGHVQALVTAYPEFGNTGASPGVRTCWGIGDATLNLEPATFTFLEKLVDTLAGLFPFPFIHFGGDEAKTGEWEKSPVIQERKATLGIETDRGVQHYFTRQLVAMGARHGKRFIGWDEIVEAGPLPTGAAVMYWRDSEKEDHEPDRAALRSGAPLVLANWSQTYFDLYQKAGPGLDFEPLAICGNLPVEKVYEWQPLDRYEPALHPLVLGAQGQAWTEYIPTRRHLDYMVYPRACALAQVLWTGAGREGLAPFRVRLDAHLPRLDRLGVAYRPFLP